ncbi:hypothetical protein BBO99_00005061 [Phytophthora kernoviae]|uniref:Chromodomain-helicase-DNA-binding protein 6 n=1 Tax=Phytophthora kernoviae TaxID=325452 RepID=A0A3R7JTW0_9STRA|nr:hypothetical protein JM16_005144 [Phytophthora kernoviae]RLN26762.1 hypothetical protein BBI17_004288 [Phytophthora kernoviae]RLN79706.1 hypothetical protein BBO99_00005061 [Phytophthora kernoviae]
MREASKMAETIELSSSESESDLVVDGATVKALQFSDDDGAEEDGDETENYVDQVETPSEDEQLPEEDTRRRSGRARKQVQSVIDLSDDDFLDSSSEEAEEAPKTKKKKAAMSKAKGKGKKAKRKRSSSNSSDEDADYESEVGFMGNARTNTVNPDSDGFIIDKVLACEVHTLKEWRKMCTNKNTRFLTHCSIFMPDEEEQKEEAGTDEKQQDGDSSTAEKQQDGSPNTVEQNQQQAGPSAVAKDDSSVAKTVIDEEEDAGEERFLIKWKKLSYLHTSWQTEGELLETDKNAKGKIQRFREKELRDVYSQNVHGDEYYSPEFRIVDRILEIRDRPLDDFSPDYVEEVSDKKLQHFLVKWKALSYDEVTWEREDDVGDDAAVEQYNSRVVRAAKRFKKIALAKHTPQTNKRKLNFRGYTAESPPPCRKEQSFQLRDYQLTGVNWMLFNWYQKRNSMLADEMGLGKTVQTVMYVNHLAVVEQVPQPFIIVAPLSTLGHWQREFDSWTNLNAVVYHGSAAARDVLLNYEFFLSEDELVRSEKLSGKSANTNGKKSSPRPKRNCYRFDVLITTYEMASATDLYKLAQIDWQLMVVDEAHRLKNRNSKLSNILHTRFKFENMLLLTGTPLQNNVEELWVLLNFLDQKKFESKEDFLESFGELTDSTQVERLHSELKPYLLRRMKEDVEKSLAPKEETIIEVELTVLQKQYYRAIYEKNTEFLARGGRKGDAPSLMNVLMELRKCCNHPFLVKGVEEREVRRMSQQKSETKEEIQRQISESLVNSSGKLVLLDKLLPRLKETNHRVLIFSQFKIMLDIVQDYLALRRYNCERIDGNITGNERQSAIDRFCRKDSNAFIMLLSTRAGGVGINLTAADTVIIYDSDWNPQNDLQAQARCHRIGQKKSVKIYRLLTSKTYELQMFHKASLKLGLDQAVLGGMQNDDPVAKLKGTKKQSNPNARMSKEEIENLLKHGAYEMFKEQESEAEAASRKFGEESIDQILSRSTTIVHDPTQNPDGSAKKNAMSSFSKATFVSSSNPDEEIDVDDPNFWTKVIGLKGVEEQKKEEPSPLKKRRCRRNVKSYLLDDSGDEFALSVFSRIGLDLEPSQVIESSDAATNGVKADAEQPNEKESSMNSDSSATAVNSPPEAILKAQTKEKDEKITELLLAEREQAMKTLQSLPHLNSPESVAPWWLSRVDDALLMLYDGQLSIGRYPLEELLAEALDLERVCRQRMHDNDGTRIIEPNEENSILGGKRGFWLLTTTQCKRLLHRVDLFRLLRTQILVLPPGQLVEVVSRVVRAQAASTDYPSWWSSPRHDILLLQGVECYGLDEHLAAVWKLPLFNSANTTSQFPTTTWVENYVTALSIACRNLIVKAREYRAPGDGYAQSSNDEAAEEVPPVDTTHRDSKCSDSNQDSSETMRRIRDIRAMREEDPYFAPTVRLRQLVETNAVRDQLAAAQAQLEEPQSGKENASKSKSKSKSDEPSPLSTPTEEVAQMQQEDPYESERVHKVWLDETKHDDIKATNKHLVTTTTNGKKHSRSVKEVSPPAGVIHLDDDEKGDEDGDDDSSVSSPPRSHSSSSSRSSRSVVQGSATAAAAAKAERQQPAVRPWDVIVIDDSEEDSD